MVSTLMLEDAQNAQLIVQPVLVLQFALAALPNIFFLLETVLNVLSIALIVAHLHNALHAKKVTIWKINPV